MNDLMDPQQAITSLASGVIANQFAVEVLGSTGDSPLVLHARGVSGSGGGPEKTILNSPRFLKPLGFDSICVYLRDPEDEGFQSIWDRATAGKVPLIAIDDHGPFDTRIRKRVGALLRLVKAKSVIWHGHDYKSNYVILRVPVKHRVHIVATVHGWVQRTWKTPLYYAVHRWCLRRCAQVVCVSTDLYQECLRTIPENRLTLIDNAIDVEAYTRTESLPAAKTAIGWDTDRLLIGAVGRLSPEKGFDLLIRSVATLIKQGQVIGCIIVGDGPERENLQAIIDQVEMSGHIKLVGFTVNPDVYYQAFDLYVLSSLREGLPNVLLEAMAHQIPVVATAIAGIPKLIDGTDNGWLVDSGDVDKLTVAINVAVASPEERARRARSGRETIETRFSFTKRMEKMVSVYRRLSLWNA